MFVFHIHVNRCYADRGCRHDEGSWLQPNGRNRILLPLDSSDLQERRRPPRLLQLLPSATTPIIEVLRTRIPNHNSIYIPPLIGEHRFLPQRPTFRFIIP